MMTGYKIRYGEYGHDCWGANEWFGWYDYDNIIYTTKDKLNEAIMNAKIDHKNLMFDFYEVDIK